eukprot:TRINITY_DN26922_c0_g1_i1.p1 TRINITY_DN26922_c0_g1~~TRINITY_DN26922_c0_g1_i1.p1  ORF type:complete len:394 (+),score=51.55 TRINITY_DN26922_c0_g1_i1:47-1183(+)
MHDLRNPYATHPFSSEPDSVLVRGVNKRSCKKCIGGTAEQMKISAEKRYMAAYREDGWKVLLRVKGTLFQNSWRTVLAVLAVSSIITAAHLYGGKWVIFHDKPHTLTIIPIGFLLVFRSNLSYQRWWDGRGMIGRMVFACRCIGIKTPTYIRGPPQAVQQHTEKVIRIVMAMVVVTRHMVQKRSSGEEEITAPEKSYMAQLRHWELSHYLTRREIDSMKENANVAPPILLNKMLVAAVVHPCGGDSLVRYKWPTAVDDVNKHVEELLSAWQGMMKIVSAPMPFPYAHSLQIFLTVWVFTIPFIMLDEAIDMEWLTVPVCAVIAILLFGINNVGAEIEDPFGNDVNDFDLVGFQMDLHKELSGILGHDPWSVNDPFDDD